MRIQEAQKHTDPTDPDHNQPRIFLNKFTTFWYFTPSQVETSVQIYFTFTGSSARKLKLTIHRFAFFKISAGLFQCLSGSAISDQNPDFVFITKLRTHCV
jgi:hypothetical protein